MKYTTSLSIAALLVAASSSVVSAGANVHEMVYLANKYCRQHGCVPISISIELNNLAQDHSNTMTNARQIVYQVRGEQVL